MIDRIISNSEAFGNLDKKKSFFLKKIKELF